MADAVALRLGLWALAAVDLLVGLYAVVSPHGFYRHVVGVDQLGPYNQHLLTDVGGFYLGFAVAFAWAARTLARELVRAVCAASAVTQLIHFVFHATHLGGFSVGDAVAQTVGLGVVLSGPLVCLRLASDGPRRAQD